MHGWMHGWMRGWMHGWINLHCGRLASLPGWKVVVVGDTKTNQYVFVVVIVVVVCGGCCVCCFVASSVRTSNTNIMQKNEQ